MFFHALFSYQLLFLLPCLGLAYPNLLNSADVSLEPWAENRPNTGNNLIMKRGILTLPYGKPHEPGKPAPSIVDPFGPSEDEPYAFDTGKIPLWGDQVYVEVMSIIPRVVRIN